MSDATPMDDAAPATRGGNGSVVPVATGPGTDFKAVGIGAGANVEGLPAYFADPLLQTGNMPGIAISAFNNRALRQGTFVASSLCEWISDQTNLYVYDDGDQINWISEWQNALAAFVEALIPPGPNLGAYLPLAGGIMVGNIQFQTGITTVVANNTWYRALDTAGQARGLIIKDSANNVTVNDGSSPYVVIGGAPVANNNFAWSGKNTSGTILPVIGLLSDNNIHIGSALTTDIYFDETVAVHHAGNFILANNRYFEALDSGGTVRQLLGLTTANTLAVGGGVTGEIDIYGNPIMLRAAATATGVFTVSGYCYLNGGARSYIPGGNDPHQIYADHGYYARHHYIVGGTRDWSCGCVSGGNFVIADESAAAVRWQIDTGGNITSYNSQTINGGLTVGSNIQCNSSINASANLSCSNTLFVYNQAQVWNSLVIQSGILYVPNGGINAAGGITGNSNTDTGNGQCNGNFNCNNQINCNTFVTNHIQDNGDCVVNGNTYIQNLSAQHVSANNGLCVGGSGTSFDYTVAFPYANHTQWVGGLGVYAQFFSPYSDERMKRNIEAVDHDALAAIKPLKFYSYDSPRVTPAGEVIDGRSHVAHGILAQQVQESLPGVIHETDQPVTFVMDHQESGEIGCHFDTQPMLAVEMMTLLTYSLRAIQQLVDRVEQLEGRA